MISHILSVFLDWNFLVIIADAAMRTSVARLLALGFVLFLSTTLAVPQSSSQQTAKRWPHLK